MQAYPAMANESRSCRVDVTASNEGESLLCWQAPLSAWGGSVAEALARLNDSTDCPMSLLALRGLCSAVRQLARRAVSDHSDEGERPQPAQ